MSAKRTTKSPKRDEDIALALPAEFMRMRGPSEHRTRTLVGRFWPFVNTKVSQGLVGALTPILDTLLDDERPVAIEGAKRACAEAVLDVISRRGQSTS